MQVKIRLFGAFRNLQAAPEIDLALVGDVSTVTALKESLARHWQSQLAPRAVSESFDAVGLLKKSALASEESILLDDQRIVDGQVLALLPPVSGG